MDSNSKVMDFLEKNCMDMDEGCSSRVATIEEDSSDIITTTEKDALNKDVNCTTNDSGSNSPEEDHETLEQLGEKCMKVVKPKRNGRSVNETVSVGDDSSSLYEVKMRKHRNRRSDGGSQTHINGGNNNNRNSKNYNQNEKIYSATGSVAASSYYSPKNFTSTFPTSTNENFSVSRIGGDDRDTVRITGYLEKRSKMLGWKKFWFVLDGRLLAYYKSKSEYDSLSVCCGSINLGIASTVRPIQIRGCKGYPIQIVTRSQVYYLRSLEKQVLEQWLIAIQEAASSQPQISLPVWSDPGSQFFRYSFAASSQWSLSNSTEDITESLKQLPQNFYLKSSSSNRIGNNLQKCHSFASLQSPSLYNTMATIKDRLNNNSSIKKKQKDNFSAIREDDNSLLVAKQTKQSSSMVHLSSSEQASALKAELCRKLSVGKTSEDTVKPSLTAAISKNDLPFLTNPIKKENAEPETHFYNEIVDFEAIYENYELDKAPHRLSNSNSTNSTAELSDPERDQNEVKHSPEEDCDTGIYESVESMADWDKEDTKLTKDLKNKQNSHIHRTSIDSNKSSETGKSELTERYRSQSIKSGSEEYSAGVTKNLPEKSDPPSTSSSLQRKLSFPLDSESSSIHSSSIHSSRENMSDNKSGKKWKNKPFGGFFHKMFHREKASKNKAGKSAPLVITGPVDLRSLHRECQNSPIHRPTNLHITEVQSSSLTCKQSRPRSGSKLTVDNVEVMDELKMKVERINHTLPLTPIADHILSKAISPDNSETFPSHNSTSNIRRTNSTLNKKPKIVTKSIEKNGQQEQQQWKESSMSASNRQQNNANNNSHPCTPGEEDDKMTSDPVVQRRRGSQSEEFQQKLAKFNRLSKSLNSTFVAALSPMPPQYPTIGGLGRSRSWKIQKSSTRDDCLPPLPPKKKCNTPVQTINYDFPRNNKPVINCEDDNKLTAEFSDSNTIISQEKVEFMNPTLRSLNKKNSAPDIIFSSSRSISDDSNSNSKDLEVDCVFEEILYPPPIPPKTKISLVESPSMPKSQDSTNMSKSVNDKSEDNMVNNTQLDNLIKPTFETVPIKESLSLSKQTKPLKSAPPEIATKPKSVPPPKSSSPSTPSLEFDTSRSLKPTNNASASIIPKTQNDEPSLKFSENKFLSETNKPSTSSSQLKSNFMEHEETNKYSSNSSYQQDSLEFGELTPTPTLQTNSSSSDSQLTTELDKIYENLKFATLNTLMNEFETVQETEDEISEMYDDFPSEYSILGGENSTPISSPDGGGDSLSTGVSTASGGLSRESVRHSGIDQLQVFLSLESNNDSISSADYNSSIADESTSGYEPLPVFKKPTVRAGAVSRLGHSSAIDQLKKIVGTGKTEL